jgi:hypothetical protein
MSVLQDVRELQETRKEHELRLAKLEKLMEASILDTQQLKLEMRLFKDEMLAFKDEMHAFKDEMKDFKDEMRAFKDEMLAFKNEMRTFKDEMLAFKDEMRTFKNEMNRRWGELANKMGTLVEDIVYPGLPFALKRRFDLEVDIITNNVSIKDPETGSKQEFDVIAICGDRGFVVDVKSTYRFAHLENFIERILPKAARLIPLLEGKRLQGIIASLSLGEDVINAATKRGVLAMTMFGDYMDIVNPEAFSK